MSVKDEGEKLPLIVVAKYQSKTYIALPMPS